MNPLTQFKTIRTLSLLIAPALVALVSPAVAQNAVTYWNETASTAIVVTAGQPPPVSALSFAMVQGAVYDAVNAIDRGCLPCARGLPGSTRPVPEPATDTATDL